MQRRDSGGVDRGHCEQWVNEGGDDDAQGIVLPLRYIDMCLAEEAATSCRHLWFSTPPKLEPRGEELGSKSGTPRGGIEAFNIMGHLPEGIKHLESPTFGQIASEDSDY
jgi:hypothetical protein